MIDSIAAGHYVPVFGINVKSRVRDSGIGRLPRMGVRNLLAENLKALMGQRPQLDTLKKITAASGGKLTNGTLDRIRRADGATRVDTLGELAEVFGLEPWQLLVENLNPKALPQLAGAELLQTIRALVLAESQEGIRQASGQTQQSVKKAPVGRFPGQMIDTGHGEKTGGVNRPGKASQKRGRRGA